MDEKEYKFLSENYDEVYLALELALMTILLNEGSTGDNMIDRSAELMEFYTKNAGSLLRSGVFRMKVSDE